MEIRDGKQLVANKTFIVISISIKHKSSSLLLMKVLQNHYKAGIHWKSALDSLHKKLIHKKVIAYGSNTAYCCKQN